MIKTKVCDMCGNEALNSKRGSIHIHHNEIVRNAPQPQLFRLCNYCYEAFTPLDFDVNYEDCSDVMKTWVDI